MQKNINYSSIWSFLALVLVAIITVGLFAGWYQPDTPVMPTAAEVADLIVIPTIDTSGIDDATAKIDKVCELTDGCEYWSSTMAHYWVNLVMDEEDDLEEALADLVGIKEKYLDDVDFDVRETQVRTYTEDRQGSDGDWETKIFARVTYQDEDEEDHDHCYVVITSIFDEGDYDGLTIEKVNRNFEF